MTSNDTFATRISLLLIIGNSQALFCLHDKEGVHIARNCQKVSRHPRDHVITGLLELGGLPFPLRIGCHQKDRDRELRVVVLSVFRMKVVGVRRPGIHALVNGDQSQAGPVVGGVHLFDNAVDVFGFPVAKRDHEKCFRLWALLVRLLQQRIELQDLLIAVGRIAPYALSRKIFGLLQRVAEAIIEQNTRGVRANLVARGVHERPDRFALQILGFLAQVLHQYWVHLPVIRFVLELFYPPLREQG